MGHRDLSHKFPMFERDQDQNYNHVPAEQHYVHMGRSVPENNYFINPMESTPGGVHYASQWDIESRRNDHSSSSINREVPHARAAVLGSSYDPFRLLPAGGGSYLASENSDHHARSSYCNRQIFDEVEVGLLDPTTGTRRGSFKRKSTDSSVSYERSSSSRYLSAGSSSSSSEFQLEKPTLNHHIYHPVPIGLTNNTGDSLSITAEDSPRNVRSRPRLDVEPNPRRTHLSSYSSPHYHPVTHMMNNNGTVDVSGTNADAAPHVRNYISVSPADRRRLLPSDSSGFSYETNQFFLGGSTAEIGVYQPESISRRNPVLHAQYLHGRSSQTSREGHANYSRRIIPPYSAGLSYPHSGHDAASPENGQRFLSETFSSRNLRPSSLSGWRNNHRNGRSRMAIERYGPHPIAVDFHERMGIELRTSFAKHPSIYQPKPGFCVAHLMVDHSSMYDSRNLFDQYRDMRLDIDNMGYEELLALGERIGNVNTGLSEYMILKCLTEKAYCFSDQKQEEEATCAICLEGYSNDDGVGSVKKCGHDYHLGCIKKWLSMKNVCPICKAPAFSDCLKEE